LLPVVAVAAGVSCWIGLQLGTNSADAASFISSLPSHITHIIKHQRRRPRSHGITPGHSPLVLIEASDDSSHGVVVSRWTAPAAGRVLRRRDRRRRAR
jgi:hypothetical protein